MVAYAGFDRADCPTPAQMRALRDKTNLVWCGYYLASPSHPRSTWGGKRKSLLDEGWGLAPIYVGQQTTQSGPGSHIVTKEQGALDGIDAARLMHDEGFPAGSWVYLDLENGPPFGMIQRAYVAAWIDAVEAGSYRAGVYGSYLMASEIKALRPSIRMWVFHVSTVRRHSAGGVSFPTPDPGSSGFPGAAIWQRDMNVSLLAFSEIVVDLDVSIYRDPSAPERAAQPVRVPPPPDIPPPPEAPPPTAPVASWWVRLLVSVFGLKPPA